MSTRALLSVVASAVLAGCGWGVQASGPSAGVQLTSGQVDTTYVDNVPPDIQTAPQVVYEGRPTYYYGNQWYYQDGGRWRTYRSEPSGLVEHRRQFEVQRQEPRREEQFRQAEPRRNEQQVRQEPRRDEQQIRQEPRRQDYHPDQVQQQRRTQQRPQQQQDERDRRGR